MTRTIMFKRDKVFIVADIFQTVLEPLDDKKRQVVYFCRDSSGKKYRVPKSEVVMTSVVDKPKKAKTKKKKGKRCCA